jgi:CDP-6-deoxy-D-xylo-4-hexulose-3-dehydrase
VQRRKTRLRRRILSLVGTYYRQFHKRGRKPGKYRIQYGGRTYDEREIISLVDAALDFWVTYGWRAQRFEKQFAKYLGLRHAVFTNSGSSANLLAVAALCSSLFEHRLRRGDEVIVPATAFPTTVNPLIVYGLRPVVVDSSVGTYNMDCNQLSIAVKKKTRAIMLPHMLGNPADIDAVTEITQKHGLILIEDACESLCAMYRGEYVGTAGELSTYSFYAPHHMTTGEGGAICTDDSDLHEILISLRDWGRGQNLAGQSGLPSDYDPRFVYATRGYNFRPLDLEAAIGLVQLRKLPLFAEKRRSNFVRLYEIFSKYDEFFVLPESLPNADPVWFGFPLTVKKNPFFTRRRIVAWLERHGIETRPVMAGNILRQPAYKDVRFRVVGKLKGADAIMNSSFFIGLYPGISSRELDFIADVVGQFFDELGVGRRGSRVGGG